MKALNLFISVVFLFICIGCADNRELLLQAESMMIEQPDSALELLYKIDIHSFNSKHSRAKYALLLSQALDKNYIDKTDFDILQPAIDYYETHGPVAEKFLAFYYQGRIQSNNEDYVQSMLSYTKAEGLIPYVSDYYSIGLLYAQMGFIYGILYDYPKSLEAYQKAYKYYQFAGKTALQYYTKLDIGRLYLQMNHNKAAEQNLMEVLQWGYENQNVSISRSCYGMLNMLYEATGDYEALQILNEGNYAEFLENELVVLRSRAYLYALRHNRQRARLYLDRAWERARVQQDTINLLMKEYQINKKLEDYRLALDYHEKVFHMQDSIVRHTLQQPVLSAQKDYFKSKSEYNALKLRHNRQIQIVIIVIAFLVILSISIFARQRMIAKNNEIVRYMDIVYNLEKTLFEKAKNADEMSYELTQMNKQINQLFIAQFDTIDKLSNTYYEMHHTQRVKDAIYAAVKKEIDIFSSKESVYRLEDIVNMHRKNIMKKTREAMPKFNELDFRLLCFIYAGFSAKAISIFTGDSIGNIYMKKSRFKAKIMQSDSIYRDEIIRYMS